MVHVKEQFISAVLYYISKTANNENPEHTYDRDFIEQLYNLYFDELCVFVKSALHSRNYDDVTGCVQDVFIVALKKKNLKQHPCIRGFLFITAKNMAKTYNRKFFREKKRLFTLDEREHTDDFTDSVDDTLEAEAFRRKIMNSLSKKEREFYKLCYLQQLEPEMIAAKLGISVNAVYIRKSRLYAKIKNMIEQGELE